jgi:hypothetical protein
VRAASTCRSLLRASTCVCAATNSWWSRKYLWHKYLCGPKRSQPMENVVCRTVAWAWSVSHAACASLGPISAGAAGAASSVSTRRRHAATLFAHARCARSAAAGHSEGCALHKLAESKSTPLCSTWPRARQNIRLSHFSPLQMRSTKVKDRAAASLYPRVGRDNSHRPRTLQSLTGSAQATQATSNAVARVFLGSPSRI